MELMVDTTQKTLDSNYFEELVDKMVLDEIPGITQEFIDKINDLPKSQKRMAILSILDKDLNLFRRIKALTDQNINKMEHIKDIILMLREYVKIGDVEKKKFGEVMTPLELVKEMLNTLPEEVWSDPHLKWLDPANGTGPYPLMVIYKLMNGLREWEPDDEKRYKHIVENMIYVCEIQPKNMFLYMCAVDPFDKYSLNIYTGSFLEEGFDKHMREVWGVDRFYINMSNPPYKSYTHLKFLNKSIDITIENGHIVYVHPSQSFLDIKPKQLVNDEKISLHNIQKFDSRMILINGNLLFNAKMFFTPLSITIINKKIRQDKKFIVIDNTKNKTYIYPSIKEVNLLGYSDEYRSLKDKIINCVSKNGHINLISKRKGNFYIGISEIRGNICEKNMIKNDFYTILPQNSQIFDTPRSKHFNAGFSTLLEAENFKSYLRTKFVRFCLALYKINSTLAGTSSVLNAIPILNFQENYDDEKLKMIFQITENEWVFIESIIPDFY